MPNHMISTGETAESDSSTYDIKKEHDNGDDDDSYASTSSSDDASTTASSSSEEDNASSHSNSNKEKNNEQNEEDEEEEEEVEPINKQDILFERCHWYDIPCPHQLCYDANIRFDSHDKFKLHHEQFHCPRGENGDIDRAKDSLRWQCPVMMSKTIDGKVVQKKCNKISNSWYNYAGHITSHKEIGHGWGCALPPSGKRKKTNIRRMVLDPNGNKDDTDVVQMTVCGKRTSTKHHLLAHMANVHKQFNVIDTNGRQYNKRKKPKKKKGKGASSKKKSKKMKKKKKKKHRAKKRKRPKIEPIIAANNQSSNGISNQQTMGLLQMPMPRFHHQMPMSTMPLPPSLQSGLSMPHFPNLFLTEPPLKRQIFVEWCSIRMATKTIPIVFR